MTIESNDYLKIYSDIETKIHSYQMKLEGGRTTTCDFEIKNTYSGGAGQASITLIGDDGDNLGDGWRIACGGNQMKFLVTIQRMRHTIQRYYDLVVMQHNFIVIQFFIQMLTLKKQLRWKLIRKSIGRERHSISQVTTRQLRLIVMIILTYLLTHLSALHVDHLFSETLMLEVV